MSVARTASPPDRYAAASDAELVRAAAAGERAAAAVAWSRYAPASRRCLRVRLGQRDDIEDLLQDVFVAFLKSVHRIRNQEALGPYLLAIAATLARLEVRRRRTRRLVALSDTGEVPEVAAPPVDFDGRESLLGLERALGRMPARVQAGYCLHHLDGVELREVARRLGVSLSTTKRAVSRARARVRRLGAQRVRGEED
ncbi:MAG TPA: sigma-70 family RNA polymerase sigma factor [Polyangia bacterium]|nr:sigma-70 family RNA polymerase sigma factor [Polyangia bacterium]